MTGTRRSAWRCASPAPSGPASPSRTRSRDSCGAGAALAAAAYHSVFADLAHQFAESDGRARELKAAYRVAFGHRGHGDGARPRASAGSIRPRARHGALRSPPAPGPSLQIGFRPERKRRAPHGCQIGKRRSSLMRVPLCPGTRPLTPPRACGQGRRRPRRPRHQALRWRSGNPRP